MKFTKKCSRLALVLATILAANSPVYARAEAAKDPAGEKGKNIVTNMQAVNPKGSNIPGISQAMIVENGRLMFLSGHVAIGADGEFAGETVEEQLQQVLANISLTLKEAGADFNNVARITIYVRDYDISMLPAIRKVRDKFVNLERPPASALIGVASLFHPKSLVEVDAIAVF